MKKKTLHDQVIEDYNNLFPEEGIVVIDGKRKKYTEKWFFKFYLDNIVNTLIVDKSQNVIFIYGPSEDFSSKLIGKNILEVRELIHTKLYKYICYRAFNDVTEFKKVCKENLESFLQDAVKYQKYYDRIWAERTEMMNSVDYSLGRIKHEDLPYPKAHEFQRNFKEVYRFKSIDSVAEYAFKNCPNLIHFYHDKVFFPREDFE